jgi:uncharacterized lipoprotein NlpE involved in copper resistance
MKKIFTLACLSLMLCGCSNRPNVYNAGDSVYVQVLAQDGQVVKYEWSLSNNTWSYLVKSKSCPDGCSYLEFQLFPIYALGLPTKSI